MQIKLRKLGNSVATTFPKEILDRFNLKEGDALTFVLELLENRQLKYLGGIAKNRKVTVNRTKDYQEVLREEAIT